ncbi:MAG: ATPase, T2SS/T4P/T4SS family, partial [Eubacterium sp.]
DEETAATAVRASITGHLVLSTLHTNDAFSSVTRLFDMGVPSYLLQAAIRGIIAQRLLRKLCPHCKRPDKATDWEQKYFGFSKSQLLYRAVGCKYCGNTGYFGRKGVFEVLGFNKELRELLAQDTTCAALQTKAVQQGFVPFSEIIRCEIEKGITDTTEGLRVMSYGND